MTPTEIGSIGSVTSCQVSLKGRSSFSTERSIRSRVPVSFIHPKRPAARTPTMRLALKENTSVRDLLRTAVQLVVRRKSYLLVLLRGERVRLRRLLRQPSLSRWSRFHLPEHVAKLSSKLSLVSVRFWMLSDLLICSTILRSAPVTRSPGACCATCFTRDHCPALA